MKTTSIRTFLSTVVFAMLAVVGYAAEPTTVDGDGHFSANFPMAVRRANRIVDKDFGQVTTCQVSWKGFRAIQVYTAHGSVAFMVVYSDYPTDYVSQTGASTICKNAAKELADGAKGTIRSTTEHKLGTIAGIEVVIDGPSGGFVEVARFYAVGERLFQVTYVGPPESETGRDALAFLNSFRILPSN